MRTLEAIRKDVSRIHYLSDRLESLGLTKKEDEEYQMLCMRVTDEILPYLNLVASTGLLAFTIRAEENPFRPGTEEVTFNLTEFDREHRGEPSLTLYGEFDPEEPSCVSPSYQDWVAAGAGEGIRDTGQIDTAIANLKKLKSKFYRGKATAKDKELGFLLSKEVSAKIAPLIDDLCELELLKVDFDLNRFLKKKIRSVRVLLENAEAEDDGHGIVLSAHSAPDSVTPVVDEDGLPTLPYDTTPQEFALELHRITGGDKAPLPKWLNDNAEMIAEKFMAFQEKHHKAIKEYANSLHDGDGPCPDCGEVHEQEKDYPYEVEATCDDFPEGQETQFMGFETKAKAKEFIKEAKEKFPDIKFKTNF